MFLLFTPFLRLRRTAWWPYRLSHIAAFCTNSFYSHKDQSLKFLRKNIENWQSWKSQYFWVGHFDFFFQKIKILLLHNYSNQSQFMGYQGWDKILMITLISNKKLGGYKIMKITVHRFALHCNRYSLKLQFQV